MVFRHSRSRPFRTLPSRTPRPLRLPAGALALTALLLAGGAASAPPDPGTVANLSAFAKLYGYVRWFHPADEAAETDWDGFAVLGGRRVLQVEERARLLPALQELFGPIAPSVQIYAADSPPAPLDLIPADADTLDLVAWQHQGVGGLGARGSAYASARTGRRQDLAVAGYGFGTVTQAVDADPYRGREIRLRAAVRAAVEGPENAAQLWLRVDRPERPPGFFDNMDDRPIRSSEWETYEITGPVADDAVRIVFGCFLNGTGEAWVDALRLDVRSGNGEWESVELKNPGFEDEGEGVPGWGAASPGYDYAVLADDAFEGDRSLRITEQRETWAGALFEGVPAAGETVEKNLGAGLAARVPLALYSRDGRTVDGAGGEALESLRAGIRAAALQMPSDDPAVRVAGVTIAWNVFQHFYPYFDVVGTDWDAELGRALADALDDTDADDYLRTLQRMVAQLHDGHGRVQPPPGEGKEILPPFRTEWIEDRVVVTEVGDTEAVRHGDVVRSVDGRDVDELIAEAESLSSGSPQWKRFRAVREICQGPPDSEVHLGIERAGERREVSVLRTAESSSVTPRREAIEELDDGVFYVDLSRAEMDSLDARAERLATAPGIVFDLRGYPRGNHGVLQHLTDTPLESARWNVPQILYPDRERIVGWNTSGRWNLEPLEPRFRGRIAFLTGAGAISYAESVMGIVENYHLGEIVGRRTAGTNGNVNPFRLPGGCRVMWTGMKVLKHDGSQHHLVGIVPTIPVSRTVRAVAEGRDEDLEAALEEIRGT